MYVLSDDIHVSQVSAKIILCNYIVWSIVVSDKDVKSLLTIALRNYSFDKLKCTVMEALYPLAIVVKISVGNVDGPNLYEVSLETKFNILLMVVPVSNYSSTRVTTSGLEWKTRLRIALDVTRGVKYSIA
ncbi:hypothetical protein GmHk_18G050825 [Glycine max]|nr:hypothetical protein GmHk_18G050825 [Glycine max]